MGWGYGKVDALSGIKSILGSASVNDIVGGVSECIVIEPVAERLYDIYAPGRHGVKAEVYSMQGVAVMERHSDGDELKLDISNLPAGVYIMHVNSESATRSLKFTVH